MSDFAFALAFGFIGLVLVVVSGAGCWWLRGKVKPTVVEKVIASPRGAKGQFVKRQA